MGVLLGITPGGSANHLPGSEAQKPGKNPVAVSGADLEGTVTATRRGHASPSGVWLIDDERGAVALEVVDGELQVFEVHPPAVEVDRRVPRSSVAAARTARHPDDPLLVGVRRPSRELFRDACVGRGRPVGSGARTKSPFRSSSIEWLLAAEADLDRLELAAAGAGVAACVSMCRDM